MSSFLQHAQVVLTAQGRVLAFGKNRGYKFNNKVVYWLGITNNLLSNFDELPQ